MGISVVIPLWNKEAEIARTLESIRCQTLAPDEVVVVDDGSTDSSADIVRGFDLPNLRLVPQENAGECAARNRGVREARQDLIAFLDADDEWEPGFLEAIAQMRAKYSGCGAYGTAWRICSGPGRYNVPSFRHVPAPGADGVLESYFAAASTGVCLWSSAVAMPKDVLEEVGGFPVGVRLGGDRETWLRVAVKHPVAFCNRVLATWYRDATNRACTLHKRGSDHAVVKTGLDILLREELPHIVRNDLSYYVARTQIYVAKHLVRSGEPKKARRVLSECTERRRCIWIWTACLLGTYLPRWLFSRVYLLRIRVSSWIRSLTGRSESKLSSE